MQASYPTVELAKLLRADWIQKGLSGSVSTLLTDSRSLNQPSGVLFFAIKGIHHNGHHYIPELYRRGVRNFVIDEDLKTDAWSEANFYKVPNVIHALQQLATAHRHQFDLPVIGITGSNGKTIVKEWLFQLLHSDYTICRSPKSYNSQIGVPLSVWRLQEIHELGIFEAGLSKMNEMQRLAPIINPQIGIFTNLGEAHSQGFTSKQQKLHEKLKLFEDVKQLIYCKDHQEIAEAIAQMGLPGVGWGTQKGADLQIIERNENDGISTITYQWRRQPTVSIEIPFTDKASVENAMHACTLMKVLNYEEETIRQRMKQLEPVAMRLEVVPGINNCIILNDSYNADLTGLQAALSFIHRQYVQHDKVAILSDLLQSSKSPESIYVTIAALLEEHGIRRIIGIGEEIIKLEKSLSPKIKFEHFPDTNVFLNQQTHLQFNNEVILVKGARRFGFERIARRLSAKEHQTRLEVNISALIHNIKTYQQYIKPQTKMMIMVKAAAYGSGSLEVARALAFHKVNYLAVAYADEGIELRQRGIDLPIMVLNPEEVVFDSMRRFKLEPEIYSLKLLNAYGTYTQEQEDSIPIHLKLDTGMHRLGFTEDQLAEILSALDVFPQLYVKTVFSHLAASESEAFDDFTKQQFTLFNRMYQYLYNRLGYRPDRHILNSNGMLRFPDYQMEMVRLGIGAYGVDETGIAQPHLQTVLKLTARISQIKRLNEGETVGYGRAGKINVTSTIATLSIGYADGVPRSAGQGKFHFLIRGKKAPVVGNICMDMCMVDVSNIPDAIEGDEAIVFSEEWPVHHLADAMGTIAYEVYANISPRVKRVYVQE